MASGMNDELDMLNGELYYSLLRVTNALDHTYIIRSNGVTVKCTSHIAFNLHQEK
jgi:hypothetical protein